MTLKRGANYIINKSAALVQAKGGFTNPASDLKRETNFIARGDLRLNSRCKSIRPQIYRPNTLAPLFNEWKSVKGEIEKFFGETGASYAWLARCTELLILRWPWFLT